MEHIQQSKLSDKKTLENRYNNYFPVFNTVLQAIEKKLKGVVSLASGPTFKSRVKDFYSYYRKLIRVKPNHIFSDNKLPVLTDMMGIRIICAFLEDISVAEQQILNVFDVIEIEKKGAALTFKEFGYESVHILIKIPEEIASIAVSMGVPLPEDCVCEIQIRTILQDAWAEVEHELVYKSEFSPFDLPLKRKLASINASLSLADIIFQEIRDYQNKLNQEIDCRRDAFYEKADMITHDMILPGHDLKKEEVLPTVSPYVRGTIDDMLLDAIHAHNTGDLDRAVDIYTKIIESEPTPNDVILSVIHKHRGMAFFAQNQFDLALEDFELSVRFQSNNFRSLYYMGIVYSVKGDYEKSIEFFNKSLGINEFQSHVYYRRALSLFNLGLYSESMNDLATANKLGLNDDDCKHLKEELMKKFDMNM